MAIASAAAEGLAGAAGDLPGFDQPRLVARDLEVERPHVPVGRLAWIRRLEMDVVDPERHERCPPSLTAISCSHLPRAKAASGRSSSAALSGRGIPRSR